MAANPVTNDKETPADSLRREGELAEELAVLAWELDQLALGQIIPETRPLIAEGLARRADRIRLHLSELGWQYISGDPTVQRKS